MKDTRKLVEMKDLTSYLKENIDNYYGFIYLTTNTENGKMYIGQKKIDNGMRWNSYIGSGHLLLKAIEKYGRDSFTRKIIDVSDNEHKLNSMEERYIKEFDAVNSELFYNMIEGGISGKVLAKNRTKPVICIDTNFIFKSLIDASRWAKYSTSKIRDSFNKKHDISSERIQLIFKPLHQLKLNHKLCSICACNFKPLSEDDKYCETCRENELFDENLYKKINRDESRTVICYISDQDWVKERLEHFENVGIKPKNRFATLKPNTKKSVKRTYGVKKIENNIAIAEDLVKFKSIILDMYSEDSSVSEIIRNLEGVKTTTIKVKEALEEWGVNIKPTCYMNYSNPIIKERYFIAHKKGDIKVFKFMFELKFWLEKYHTAKINKSFIELKIKNKEKINSYTIEELSSARFKRLSRLYKTVDRL